MLRKQKILKTLYVEYLLKKKKNEIEEKQNTTKTQQNKQKLLLKHKLYHLSIGIHAKIVYKTRANNSYLFSFSCFFFLLPQPSHYLIYIFFFL